MKKYKFELRPNFVLVNGACPICGRRTDPNSPIDVFERESDRIICDPCRQEHCPEKDTILKAVSEYEHGIFEYRSEEKDKLKKEFSLELARILPLIELGWYKQAADELTELKNQLDGSVPIVDEFMLSLEQSF